MPPQCWCTSLLPSSEATKCPANPFLSMQSGHPASYCSTTQKSTHAQPTPSVVLGLRTRYAQQTWQQWCRQRNQQCQLSEFQSSEHQQLTRDRYGAAFALPGSLCLPREDLAAQTVSVNWSMHNFLSNALVNLRWSQNSAIPCLYSLRLSFGPITPLNRIAFKFRDFFFNWVLSFPKHNKPLN